MDYVTITTVIHDSETIPWSIQDDTHEQHVEMFKLLVRLIIMVPGVPF